MVAFFVNGPGSYKLLLRYTAYPESCAHSCFYTTPTIVRGEQLTHGGTIAFSLIIDNPSMSAMVASGAD